MGRTPGVGGIGLCILTGRSWQEACGCTEVLQYVAAYEPGELPWYIAQMQGSSLDAKGWSRTYGASD